MEEGSWQWEHTKLRISIEIHLLYQCRADTLKILLYTQIRSLKCCQFGMLLIPISERNHWEVMG